MLWLWLFACASDVDKGDAAASSAPLPDGSCAGLYGMPNEVTGLDDDQCFPAVEGATETWTPPAWTAADLDGLRAWTLEGAPAVPDSDPYLVSPPVLDEQSVCGMRLVDGTAGTYTVETYSSVDAADAAGADVTHGGACGLCSSLEDLAVYAGIADLTSPVRACGVAGLSEGVESVDQCLQDMGFSPPCARIWAYNTQHTQAECLGPCIELLSAPYHEPDGSLNACLQCDEDLSGPVFKAVAGRTRRNSGLATALCRPCETVWRVDHALARGD